MDQPTRDQLIEAALPMAKRVAWTQASILDCPDLADDLAQEAAVALVEAANMYDPGRGASFATYALHRVKKATFAAALRLWSAVPPSAVDVTIRHRVADAQDRLEQQLRGPVGLDAARLEAGVSRSAYLRAYIRLQPMVDLGDVDQGCDGGAVALLQQIEMLRSIARLPGDLRQVVELRHGLTNGGGECRWSKVAGEIRASEQVVRRRYRQALDILREQ